MFLEPLCSLLLFAQPASVVPTGWGGGAGSFGITFLIMSPGAWINQCCSSADKRPTAQIQSYLGMPVMGAPVTRAGLLHCVALSECVPLFTCPTLLNPLDLWVSCVFQNRNEKV